jgi:threonylcarbamoyladenosine tRNA methylthiotransferase MtaB
LSNIYFCKNYRILNKTAAFYTLGCKLNFAETSTISRQIKNEGYQVVDFAAGADLYVINTCSVTENADRKCRALIRKALALNSNAYIIVVGCYAQLKPREIVQIPGVDLVLGANEKFNISKYVEHLEKKAFGEFHSCGIMEVEHFNSGFSMGDRTRSFLKIQDGCDYPCTYCTIPLARGKSRSDTIKHVVGNAKLIAEQDIREIVLTGVNTGDFGKHAERGESFYDLLKALEKVNIQRFRLSSIEPNLLTDEIIDLFAASEKFMPHFHIPLQSGSDQILKLMRRRYLSDFYQGRIEYINAVMPDTAIGVDVIVGFPGETDLDFNRTYDFIKELEIAYLHVFSYSERPNTIAVDLPGKISAETIFKRSQKLRALSIKKKNLFYSRYLKQTRPVLFEGIDKNGKISGFTDNYIKVTTDFDNSLVNTIYNVFLDEIDDEENMKIKLFEKTES